MIIKYRNLIPALNANEFELLEANILEEGVRDSLVVWGDILVDGHNRYEIAQKHNLEFNTIQKEFANENEVKVWIIQNQLARRNLSDWQRYELTSERRKILEAEGKKNLRKATGSSKGMTLSTNDKVINTRDQIAKELNWAVGKLAQADIVNKKADIETKQRIRDNDITIHQAYSDIKKQERAELIQQQKEDIESGKIQSPEGLFDIIVVDPPWEYSDSYDPDTRRGTITYPSMKLQQIGRLDILAADDSILWLWTTQKYLRDAFDILQKWGFDYKATLVWNKDKMGIGRRLRMQCEFCLLGIKGKPLWDATDIRDIITEKRREHSRKPEGFYKMIDDNFVGKKLDFFSREEREGWERYGTTEF